MYRTIVEKKKQTKKKKRTRVEEANSRIQGMVRSIHKP